MMAAPCITPVQPKCPRTPVLGGTYGCQFAGSTYLRPAMTMITMMPTLRATMIVLAPADPRTPTYKSAVMAAMRSESVIAGPEWFAATVPVSTKMPEPMVAPRPMAMSARALSTCFRRLLPEESAGSIGRTAHSCRRIEARGAPAPWPLSLLIALDITLAFFHPRARPRQSLIRDGAQVRGRLGVGGVLAFAPPARSVQPATLFRR